MDAKERFCRIMGRNCLISQKIIKEEITTDTKEYIERNKLDTLANIQFNLLPIATVIFDIPSKLIPHNYTDKWLLFESSYAVSVFDWFKQTIK